MHISIEGDARSGRPKEAVSDENIKKVHKIILNGHKVNLIEIAETLKISKKRVRHIVHEYLDMLKLFAKWLLRLLTIDQNPQRIDDSEQCLAAIFYRNKHEFFRWYITMDVSWLLYNTQESNRQSAEWTERDEPNPKHGKTQRSAGVSTMGCACYYIHRLPQKGPEHQQRLLHGVIGAFKWYNQEKKQPNVKKKSAVSSRHYTESQINQNDGKFAWINIRIASSFTVFSRSGLPWPFSVCRPQKNACWKKKISTNEEIVVEN
jgi:hypothetical protein